jgi:DNA mismatch endonuclease, patch repair protein
VYIPQAVHCTDEFSLNGDSILPQDQVMDTISPERRSKLMSRIRSSNTKPEIAVRSMLHGLGFRFRVHVKSLPGTPDIVLRKYRSVILVHGCFWHSHRGCKRAFVPSSNRQFWLKKLSMNRQRDKRVVKALKNAGWNVLLVWECQLRHPERLVSKLLGFLEKN